MSGQAGASSVADDRKRLGARLREARTYLGFTQEEVAEALEVPRSALSEIEGGRRRIEVQELKRLAKLYRQPVSYFTDEDETVSALPPDVMHLARKVADLSKEDRSELQRFTEYLQGRSKTGK